MSKDPAFLFYPGDWLGGTMGFSFEQKGCYFELLMLQFNAGKFTESQAKEVLSICFDHAWHTIKHKFNTDGIYYWNERLAEEKEKRTKFIESRRLCGLTPKKQQAYAKHTPKRTENGNEDDILIDNVVNIYNNTTFPKILKLSEKRKIHVKNRISEYGSEKVIAVLNQAEKSKFLHGENNNNWKAGFDWIFNASNFLKIMEGNYDNRNGSNQLKPVMP